MLTVALFYFTRTENDAPKYKKLLQVIVQVAAMVMISCILTHSKPLVTVTIEEISFGIPMQLTAIFALIPLWMYDEDKGTHSEVTRFAFYIFYPMHMMLLDLLF